MKAFVKNFRDYVDALVNLDSKLKKNKPIFIEFFSYVSEFLESFETSFLRESNRNVGDLLKKDPDYKTSFSEKLHETYNMVTMSDYFMKLFNTKLFVFLNRTHVDWLVSDEYSVFNLNRFYLWRFFGKYLRPYNKVLKEFKRLLLKRIPYSIPFIPKVISSEFMVGGFGGTGLEVGVNEKIRNNINILYDTFIESYSFEKDFIKEYKKQTFLYSLDKYKPFEVRSFKGRKSKSLDLLRLLRSEDLINIK